MAFDLDNLVDEDEPREPFTFIFDGKEYSLPAQMDIRALAAIEAGRLDDGLRMLFNPEQWDAIQASPKMLSRNRLRALYNAYTEYVGGASLGESSASTGSSKSTARPSKRISKGSTK